MPRAAPPATADDGSSTAAAPEPSMTSVSTTTVTDPSSVNTESAGVEDAESSQGGKPTQLESGNDLTAEEEALLAASATTLAAPAATRAATDENPGQQPHRHHMALRSQVPVGEGRLPDTQDTHPRKTAPLPRQRSVAPSTAPSAAESVAPTPIPPSTPTTPDGADLAPVHQGDEPIRSRAPDTSPRVGDSNLWQVGIHLLNSRPGAAPATFNSDGGTAGRPAIMTSGHLHGVRQEQVSSPTTASELELEGGRGDYVRGEPEVEDNARRA